MWLQYYYIADESSESTSVSEKKDVHIPAKNIGEMKTAEKVYTDILIST